MSSSTLFRERAKKNAGEEQDGKKAETQHNKLNFLPFALIRLSEISFFPAFEEDDSIDVCRQGKKTLGFDLSSNVTNFTSTKELNLNSTVLFFAKVLVPSLLSFTFSRKTCRKLIQNIFPVFIRMLQFR